MKKPILKGSLFAFAISLLIHPSANAQIGKISDSYYDGMGVDYKCTGGIVLPDSSIIITGKFRYVNQNAIKGIAKLKSDGTLDPTFDPGTGADDYVNVVIAQPDGKLIIGGEFVKYNGAVVNRIARLNPDGSIDASFATGSGFNGAIYALYLQADGKILVGGGFSAFNGSPAHRVARLNEDGTLDNAFMTGGGCDGSVFSLDQQADGKIIIAGDFNNYNGTPRAKIARINLTGALDATFNVIDTLGPNSTITATAMTVGNKIIVAGFFNHFYGHACGYIIRLNTDGTEDTTFQCGTGFTGYINEMLIQPDGKILVDGDFMQFNGTAVKRVARLHIDGTLDSSFNPVDGPNQRCNALFLDQSNRIYIGGFFTRCGPYTRLRLARLLNDGSLDTGFLPESKLNGAVLAAGFQSDGKAIVAGQFTTYNNAITKYIARLNADGSLDNAFNTGTGADHLIRAVVVLPNDKILIGGDFTSYNGVAVNRIALLNADGSLDNTFATGTGPDNKVHAIAVDNTGKIYIGGEFMKVNGINRHRLARLNPDGSLDNTFSISSGCNNIVRTISLQADGKIIVGGAFTAYAGQPSARIVRLNTDGTKDNTFTASINNLVAALCVQADGKIIAGGSFMKCNGILAKRIVRLQTDGSTDAGFSGSVNNGMVNSLCMVNQWIMAGGNFTNVNGSSQHRITFFNPDGTVNTTQCLAASGAANTVNCLAFQTEERYLLIGGMFESVQSNLSVNLAKLEGTNIGIDNVQNIPCPGLGIPVVYHKMADFNAGNTITVQLSDAHGKFDSAMNIGSITSNVAGNDIITATVPYGVFAGSNYKIRLISNNPVDTSRASNAFSITIPPSPTITYSGATTFCNGQSLPLTASAGVAYQWSNGESTQTAQATTSGVYKVSVTDNNNCTASSDPVTIVVNPLPDATITLSSVSLCNGGSIQLQATPGNNYQWSNGNTAGSIIINQSGTYSVTATNSYGCQSDSSVYVDLSAFYGHLIQVEGASTFCPGNNVTLKAILPNYTYLWNNLATTQGIVVASTDVYSVTISDGTCSMTDSVPITVYPKPNVHLTPGGTASFCLGSDLTISAAAGLSYQWNTGETSQSITVNASGEYYTTLFDPSTGCTVMSDTVQAAAQNCSGIQDIAAETWKIDPNPASSQLNIVSGQAFQHSINIYDMVGNKVIAVEDLSFSNVAAIDVSSLAAGPYFVESGGQKLRFIKVNN